MKSAGLGALLGLANTLFIGFAFAGIDAELDLVLLVLMFGGVPGVVLGTLLGWVAGSTAEYAIPFRLFVLIAPALALVWVLGALFLLEEVVLVCMIPTLVCALVLEKRTRRVEPEIVPSAIVQR